MKRLATIFVTSVSLLTSGASAETLAITGGTVVVGDGSAPMEGATVILRNDKVVAAGRNVSIPANARRIDATGKWVTPGIFAGFSRVGLIEVGLSARPMTPMPAARSFPQRWMCNMQSIPSLLRYRSAGRRESPERWCRPAHPPIFLVDSEPLSTSVRTAGRLRKQRPSSLLNSVKPGIAVPAAAGQWRISCFGRCSAKRVIMAAIRPALTVI